MFKGVLLFLVSSQVMAADCIDLIKRNANQASLNNVTLVQGQTTKFCYKLPAPQSKDGNPIVEIKTVNKGNSSCSDVVMKVVRPNKPAINGSNPPTTIKSNGSQPGVASIYTVGKWVIKMTLNHGCDRYDLSMNWSLK